MCLKRKKGKSIVLSRGFCSFDSETEQRVLIFWHYHYSDVRSYSSAPESNKQNPRERTLLYCPNFTIFFFETANPKENPAVANKLSQH